MDLEGVKVRKGNVVLQLWPFNPQTSRPGHCDATEKAFQVLQFQDILYKTAHLLDTVLIGPEQQDAGVVSWGVLSYVGEGFVASDEKPPLFLSGLPEHGIKNSGQPFFHNC